MKRERLSYDQRQKMIDYLVHKAQEKSKPLTISIYDDSRVLISLTMMDGMHPRSCFISGKKAYTSALMERRTQEWWSFIKELGIELDAFSDPQMTYLPGGAPIINKDGDLLGAIGISGWTMEEDQQLADEAVALLEL